MRLEYVCDMELLHQEEPIYGGKNVLVRPYGSEEGTAYGAGDGTCTGMLQGNVRWVNHPHRRSDGIMLPDTRGVVMTSDGAAIMFSFQGRTLFEGSTGKQTLHLSFEAEDERYRWLNQRVCVAEGIVDARTWGLRARVYACVHELALPPR